MKRKVKWQTPNKNLRTDEDDIDITEKKQREIIPQDQVQTDRREHQVYLNPQQRAQVFQYDQPHFEQKQVLQKYMNASQYSQASSHIKNIKYIKAKQKKKRMRSMSEQHLREKSLIKNSYRQEIKRYKKSWQQIFTKFSYYEQQKRNQLRGRNNRDRQYCQSEIIRRCQSVKPSVQLAKLNQLEFQQKLLRKRGQTTQLRRIRSQKKKLRDQCQEHMQKQYQRIIEQQNTKYKERETLRYRSFIQKIRQQKKDYEQSFKKGHQILRQKLKNVLKNLQHEQIVQMNELLKIKIY